METDTLTTAEVAAYLRVKPKTIRQWAHDGKLPAIRIGRKTLRFHLPDVLAALRAPNAKGGGHDEGAQ
jgi:excisionase family DNA binding protein